MTRRSSLLLALLCAVAATSAVVSLPKVVPQPQSINTTGADVALAATFHFETAQDIDVLFAAIARFDALLGGGAGGAGGGEELDDSAGEAAG